MSERDEAVSEILLAWNRLPEEARSDFTISFSIIREALGLDWLTKHFDPDSSKPGILRLGEGTTEEDAIRNYRTIDLAELLINLKDIEGLSECLSRLRTSDNPEAGLAELHIAKMLHINGWNFRFIKPQGKKGNDYDFEVMYYGQTLFGDAKCKIEATDLSSKTITQTLSKSRTQLPPNGPGVFFIKLPQHWIAHPDWERTTIQGALDFFTQGTGRVVSVVFYVEPLAYKNGILSQGHLFKEVANPRRKFGKSLNWKLFERWKPQGVQVNAMPAYWIRFSNFPTGLPGYEKAR